MSSLSRSWLLVQIWTTTISGSSCSTNWCTGSTAWCRRSSIIIFISYCSWITQHNHASTYKPSMLVGWMQHKSITRASTYCDKGVHIVFYQNHLVSAILGKWKFLACAQLTCCRGVNKMACVLVKWLKEDKVSTILKTWVLEPSPVPTAGFPLKGNCYWWKKPSTWDTVLFAVSG